MAMKKTDTREAIASTLRKGMERAEHSGTNVSKDEFTVIQPFDGLNAVIVAVESDIGSRPMSIKVTDMVVILERQEDTLGVFKQRVGDRMSQKSCKEKPVIFSSKDYYITRENIRNVRPCVFSESKVLFKGYFNTVEAILLSLTTNSLLISETWTINLKNCKEPILEMKEQIILNIKQYFTEQASNLLDDLEEDELFNQRI